MEAWSGREQVLCREELYHCAYTTLFQILVDSQGRKHSGKGSSMCLRGSWEKQQYLVWRKGSRMGKWLLTEYLTGCHVEEGVERICFRLEMEIARRQWGLSRSMGIVTIWKTKGEYFGESVNWPVNEIILKADSFEQWFLRLNLHLFPMLWFHSSVSKLISFSLNRNISYFTLIFRLCFNRLPSIP